MTTIITPTPGRVVWFYPAEHDGIGRLGGQPLAAIVAGVHNDRLVNLAVFDAYGNTQQRSNVPLVQPSDANRPAGGAWAEWMPYQIGQAAKTQEPLEQASSDSETGDSTAGEEFHDLPTSGDVEESNTQAPAGK